MKICAIGDPHGDMKKIRNIPLEGLDMIILTGDIGKADLARQHFFLNQKRKQEGLGKIKLTPKEAQLQYKEIHESTLDTIKYLSKFAPVYFISGNVGIISRSYKNKQEKKYGVKFPCTTSELDKLENNYFVRNTVRRFNNARIGFLEYFVDVSWVEEFKPKDYKKALKRAKKETDKAKKILDRFSNIDVLVCHQPPYGILDTVNFKGVPESWKGKHAGSKTILSYIKKYHPRYVFCGHIHEAEGHKKIGQTEVYNLGVSGYKIIEL